MLTKTFGTYASLSAEDKNKSIRLHERAHWEVVFQAQFCYNELPIHKFASVTHFFICKCAVCSHNCLEDFCLPTKELFICVYILLLITLLFSHFGIYSARGYIHDVGSHLII